MIPIPRAVDKAMKGLFGIAVLTAAAEILTAWSHEQVIYGKYFSLKKRKHTEPDHFYGDNMYYVYNPPRNADAADHTNPYEYTNPNKHFRALAPTVVHFYGCGWKNCGGPWTKPGPIVGQLISNGIAAVSVGYRRITTSYWYDDQNAKDMRSPEELIHVDEDGRMTLDASKPMSSYEARVCRHELITKSVYDAKVAMDHLVAHSFTHGLDMNRLVFWAYSAGGSMSQYLTHVYHRWNVGAYTPLGMFYRSSMLDLPTANIMDRVWQLISKSTKNASSTKLKDLIAQKDCYWVVGNGCGDARFDKYLEPGFSYKICNSTWNDITMKRYCGDGFSTATVGDLISSQRWPKEDSEVGAGMERIWYASKNIPLHTPKPFYTLLYNRKEEDYGLLHSSLYIPAFKRAYHEAGVYYTAYYDTHPEMQDYNDTMGSAIEDVVMGDGHKLKYQSNHDWRELLSKSGRAGKGDSEEFLSYICFVLSQPGCSPQLSKSAEPAEPAQPARQLQQLVYS